MSSTVFTDYKTPIVADWLNDVNNIIYTELGGAGMPTLTGNTGSTVIGGTWYDASTGPVSTLATSTGANLLGYTSGLTGQQARSVSDKLLDSVNLFDFLTTAQKNDVKAGTVTLDLASAMTAALATGYPVVIPHKTGWKYKFGSTISVPSNARILSKGASIFLANSVNNHVFRIADGADNVLIEGLFIDGNRTNNTGGNGIAMGGTGGTNITIKDCFIINVSAHGIYVTGTTVSGIYINGNRITNARQAGISIDSTVSKFIISNNLSWLNGEFGVGLTGVGNNGSVVGNVCWDNGQAIPTADNITGYNAGNTDIVFSGNICKGGLNNGMHVGGSRLVVTSNVVTGATQYGISVFSNGVSVTDDINVTGNLSYANGVSGIWIQNSNSGTVSCNVSRDNIGHGIAMDNLTDVTFVGNSIRGNGGDGFRNGTASSWLTFTGNNVRHNTGDGIELGNVTLSNLTGNTFRENTGWGINVSGTEGQNMICSNLVHSNTAGQIKQPATTTRVSTNETSQSRTVASAATLTLPPGGDYFYITGTTGITSITTSYAERRVTMQFDDALTITEGGNLRMAGNFTTGFSDTITFICDGTNWIETSRSNN